MLARRPVQVGLLVFVLALLLSIVLAPDTNVPTSDWVRLVTIGVLAAAAVLLFASASEADRDESVRRNQLLGAGVAAALAIILCLTFSLGTAIVFSIGVSLVTAIAGTNPDRRSPWALTGVLLVTVPAWVWSALDAWTWGLLLLVPICLIGVVSDGHLRAAQALSPTVTSALTSRGHRLAGWLGVLVAALLVVIAGMPADNASGVVALGAAGALILVAIDMYADQRGARLLQVSLVDTAVLWIIVCWIVSL
ncbi:MAG TPA: hypothetical protein VD767_04710 [Thermomicrobiales bacterium]|nr:hypothetical protein [Thermomicrobiales bacterium]